MSTPLEIAEREAAEAEAENPDEEPVEPIEGDNTNDDLNAEPAQEPSSQKVIEDYERKAKSEATRHENALAKLHPDDWESYSMCPLCIGDGFLLPIPPGQQPDQIWEAVQALSGRMDSDELAVAPFAERCEVCRGKGMLSTTADNDANRKIVCRNCAGFGWLDIGPPTPGMLQGPNVKKAQPNSPTLVSVPTGVAPPAEPWPDYTLPFIPFEGGVADQWGRPAGHGRWGMPTTADGRTL